MAETAKQSDPPRESIERGYEVGDVSLRWVAIVVAACVVLAVLTHLFLTVVLHRTFNRARSDDRPRSIVTDEQPPRGVPPLQPAPWHDRTPYEDLRVMRSDEAKRFESIGWKPDEVTKVPHVPDDVVARVAARERTAPQGATK